MSTTPTGARRVIVIPCSARKKAESAPAGELYTGSYHRACRATADALADEDTAVLVLSARYGLVRLDEVLEPYDVTFGDRGAVSGLLLAAQARRLGVDKARTVTILAGAAYVEAVRSIWPYADTPLAGLAIGRQRQRLAQIRDQAARPVEQARGPHWRTTQCEECDWTIEVNQ